MTTQPMKPRPSWPDPWRCTVEVLVISGCPGTALAISRVREATEALGIETNLRVVTVDGEEHARTLGFVGSPTIRVEGTDVEVGADLPIGLACRLYPAEEEDGSRKEERAPPLAWIKAALARNAPLLGPKRTPN
jgi:hypothetical protein